MAEAASKQWMAYPLEPEPRDAVVGTDAQGRNVYAFGYRDARGIWRCPPGFSVHRVVSGTVFAMRDSAPLLGGGNRVRTQHLDLVAA